ncbi:predicted protein [Listeria monocytogenes J2818]|nr:predicted protein [Listeria monocytogenes J2818]
MVFYTLYIINKFILKNNVENIFHLFSALFFILLFDCVVTT